MMVITLRDGNESLLRSLSREGICADKAQLHPPVGRHRVLREKLTTARRSGVSVVAA
ncbi:MAG: hypothetical protein WCA12_16390 [Burkholderiales bacterium]